MVGRSARVKIVWVAQFLDGMVPAMNDSDRTIIRETAAPSNVGHTVPQNPLFTPKKNPLFGRDESVRRNCGGAVLHQVARDAAPQGNDDEGEGYLDVPAHADPDNGAQSATSTLHSNAARAGRTDGGGASLGGFGRAVVGKVSTEPGGDGQVVARRQSSEEDTRNPTTDTSSPALEAKLASVMAIYNSDMGDDDKKSVLASIIGQGTTEQVLPMLGSNIPDASKRSVLAALVSQNAAPSSTSPDAPMHQRMQAREQRASGHAMLPPPYEPAPAASTTGDGSLGR